MLLRKLLFSTVIICLIVRYFSSSKKIVQREDDKTLTTHAMTSSATDADTRSSTEYLTQNQLTKVPSFEKVLQESNAKFKWKTLRRTLQQAPRSSQWLTIVWLIFLLYVPIIRELSGLDITDRYMRFSAGLHLASIGSFGWPLIERGLRALKERNFWRTVDEDIRFRPIAFLGAVMMIAISYIVWHVGWIANNANLAYGFGSAIAVLTFKFGPLRLVNHDFKASVDTAVINS
jgi:hypothetical protein